MDTTRALVEAARTIAREDVAIPGLREGTVACFFCDGTPSYTGETGHEPEPLKHSPDCPYTALWAALQAYDAELG